MEKGQQDLEESRRREESLQERLKKAELELRHTEAKVADLQQITKKGEQDLKESEEREVDLKVRLMEAASDLNDVKAQVKLYR